MEVVPVMRFTCVLFALMLLSGCVALGDEAPAVANFRLTDHTGSSHELFRLADSSAVVVLAYSPECAVAKEGAAALSKARAAAGEAGPAVLGINVTGGDDRAKVAEALGDVALPVLMDPAQTVSKSLGFTQAGEVVVIVPGEGWRVVYRGALNAAALQAYLKGDLFPAAVTEAAGQAIVYPDYSGISYVKDIAPILETKCFSCHREGGLGPFAFSDYKKVLGWSDMIHETVRTKRMPPWHADTAVGAIEHKHALSAEEEGKLLAWIEAGAPQDVGDDPLVAAAAKPAPGAWTLGEPDHIVRMQDAQELPAEGIVNYRYIPVAVGIDEDKWVRAMQVRSDNPKVLHHALLFITYPREYRHLQPRPSKGLRGYFASFVPGAEVTSLPDDAGVFLPKGSVLTFQMHYTTIGKATQERSELGLYFHESAPSRAVRVEAGHENDFAIPPHAKDHPTKCDYEFRRDAEILGLSPHMHYRGSRFRFTADYPDGEQEDLLNVPWYEFDWQPMYFLEKPLKVPEGTRIVMDGGFDNSRFNRKNPNPEQMIRFGEQSFQEMFIGYVQYATQRDPDRYQARELEPHETIGMGEMITQDNIVGMKFRIVEELQVEFKPDGKLHTLQGYPMGTYVFETPTQIKTKSLFGEIVLFVVGDELFFDGNPLRRIG